MERAAKDFRIFLRATGILAELRTRHLLVCYGLRLFAGLVAIFGLVMLNLSGYLALEPSLGHVLAAGTVAIADFLIALALAGLSNRQPSGREFGLAEELHAAALDAVLADARSLQAIVQHPADALLPGLVAPLATLLVSRLKKSTT